MFTMKEFLYAYADNLLKGLEEEEIGVRYLTIECDFCPFQKACQKATEAGCELGCAQYIKTQLADGDKFER